MRKFAFGPLAVALAVAAVLFTIPALAQTAGDATAGGGEGRRGRHQRRGAEMRERFAQELNLTQEQRDRIDQIRQADGEALRAARQDFVEKRRALQDAMLSDPSNQSAIDARTQDVNAARTELQRRAMDTQRKVYQVLTPEQRERVRQMRAEHGGRGKGFGRGAGKIQ